jgi:hypothetical protein
MSARGKQKGEINSANRKSSTNDLSQPVAVDAVRRCPQAAFCRCCHHTNMKTMLA